MAEIRLNKLTKRFNIGLQTLVDFLNEKGAGIDLNPNAKVSDEYLPELEKKFGDDLKAAKEAAQVDIKMKEIIEKNTRKQQDEEDEFEPVRETIIKSTSLGGAPRKEEESVEEEPVEVVETPEEPEVAVTEPQPIPEPEPEPQPEPEPEPQPEPEPEEEEQKEIPAPAENEVPEPEQEQEKTEEEAVQTPAAPQAPVQAPANESAAAEVGGPSLKIVGKVDLSQFDTPKKKRKRERIAKDGSKKVDVAKVEAVDPKKKKDNKKDDKSSKKKGRDRFKPAMTEAEQEEMQKEIQKQVKET